MKKWPLETGVLHFIGIGGIGVSGIAEIMHRFGYQVQGSDSKASANTKRLEEKNINIFIGHDADNLKNTKDNKPIEVVVYSSAVKQDNPEIVAAKKNNIPVIRRAEMLAELMRFKNSIAIAGTHGKTTTTSLIGHVMEKTELDPTIINGGIANSYGSNVRIGESDWMVVEVDESDGSFTLLPSSIGVITNIDPEHMDFYDSFDEVKDAYRKFIYNIPFYGFAVACTDDDNVKSLISDLPRKIISYGFKEGSDVRATNLRNTAEGMRFDVSVNIDKENQIINDVLLPMFGAHNVLNALSCIAICTKIGVSVESIKQAFVSFKGVRRRFTTTGVVNGIRIIDDYAHHPKEIKAVLGTAKDIVRRESNGGRIIAVMQPHRYSRLSGLFDEFCESFSAADAVIIADVYTAGEEPIANINKTTLVQGIINTGHKLVHSLDNVEQLPELIKNVATPHDMVLFLGAGDITSWAQALPNQLLELNDNDSTITQYANDLSA